MNETILVVETFATDTVSAVQDMLSRGQSLAYIVAALLFILALAGLSKQKSAMRGNVLGIIGMVGIGGATFQINRKKELAEAANRMHTIKAVMVATLADVPDDFVKQGSL